MDFLWVSKYSGLLLKALSMTFRLGMIAVFCGTFLGMIVGIVNTTKKFYIKPFRFVFKIYIEIFRGCPLLVQLFMVYFGLPYIGIKISLSLTTFLVFTLYSGAYIAEIVRSGIEAIPKGQWESAQSLCLNYWQIMLFIILPQTIKLALAPLIGFYIGMIKDTSLASVIGYSELVRGGQSIMNLTGLPFETYIIIGLCYFMLCYPLSKLVNYVERRTCNDRS